MGGNGSNARGRSDYLGVGKIKGSVVVEGTKGKHNLPFLATDGKARIRLNPDGSFRQMRIYDKKTGRPRFDLDYTFEPALSIADEPVLHYHEWTEEGDRGEPKLAPEELYEEYKPYLEGVKFDEKR